MQHFEDMLCNLTSCLNLMLGNFLTRFITLYYNLVQFYLWYSLHTIIKKNKDPSC